MFVMTVSGCERNELKKLIPIQTVLEEMLEIRNLCYKLYVYKVNEEDSIKNYKVWLEFTLCQIDDLDDLENSNYNNNFFWEVINNEHEIYLCEKVCENIRLTSSDDESIPSI